MARESDQREYVYFNDGLVESGQAYVSIHDAGLLHGVGLFETMRSYQGRVFRLQDHLDRLFTSAKALQIVIRQKPEQIGKGIEDLLKSNDLQDARLRLTVTRGNLKNVSDEAGPESVLFITAGATAGYPSDYYQHGMTVIISSYKQNPDDPLAGHKTLNYLGRLVALQEAQSKHAGEALWFTPRNYLAEGCISNIFLVQDGKLLTPPLDTPVLPGVTRKVVLELARANEIECEEKTLFVKELLAATEVFLTNSVMELMPVCRIERHAVGQDKPGEVYQKLHQLYHQAVQEGQ